MRSFKRNKTSKSLKEMILAHSLNLQHLRESYENLLSMIPTNSKIVY